MSGGMLPYLYDEEYSVILLGTVTSPGKVTISEHDRPENWAITQAKGSTGASTRLNGRAPGKFKASFYLADQDDFDRWEDFQKLIESTTNGPKPFALPIYHPDLARNHFTEVTNGGISGMVHDGLGGATIVVTFLEYLPPKPKPAAKPTAKPSSGGGRVGTTTVDKPDPNAAAKAELAELLAVARRP